MRCFRQRIFMWLLFSGKYLQKESFCIREQAADPCLKNGQTN